MVLRGSAELEKQTPDLEGIINRRISLGIRHGDTLMGFADAVLGDHEQRLKAARARLVDAMGDVALVGAAAIIANFSRNDRLANACGIPLERDFVEQGTDIVDALDLKRFSSSANSFA